MIQYILYVSRNVFITITYYVQLNNMASVWQAKAQERKQENIVIADAYTKLVTYTLHKFSSVIDT